MDKFYTKPEIAFECYECLLKNINTHNTDVFIEPAAGNGSFYFLFPEKQRIGIDIEPDHQNIIKQDFFTFIPPKDQKIIIIGNPPFGKRAKLSIEFFQYASTFSTTIAFILPLQWEKWSVQKHIPKEWKLIVSNKLPKNSFLFDGKEKNINCCFQIWTKEDINKNMRIKEKPLIKHSDFEMYLYNNTKQALKFFDYKWDFAVPRQGFYDYSVRETNKNKCSKHIQWMFFKAKNKDVLDKLLKLDFEKLSRKNTTIPGFGKADIIEEYNKPL